jgi:hypothetical protein
MAAVIGIAMKTPRRPYKVPKASTAKIPTRALTPTALCMIRGMRNPSAKTFGRPIRA